MHAAAADDVVIEDDDEHDYNHDHDEDEGEEEGEDLGFKPTNPKQDDDEEGKA